MEKETIIYGTTKDKNGKYYKIKMKVIEVTEITQKEYEDIKNGK